MILRREVELIKKKCILYIRLNIIYTKKKKNIFVTFNWYFLFIFYLFLYYYFIFVSPQPSEGKQIIWTLI